MFCRNCGKHLPDDTRFCDACGAPTALVSPTVVAPAAPAKPSAPSVPSAPKDPEAAKKESADKVFAEVHRREFFQETIRPILIILAVAALIIVLIPSFTGTRAARFTVSQAMNCLRINDLHGFTQKCTANFCSDAEVDHYRDTIYEEDGYNLKFKIKDVKDMDEDDLEDLQESYLEFYDTEISNAKKVKVLVTETRDDDTTRDRFTFIVAKINDDWKILYTSIDGLYGSDQLWASLLARYILT